MSTNDTRIFGPAPRRHTDNSLWLLTALFIMNGLLWMLVYLMFHQHPLFMGAAALAYTLGLRHALDADHICAIDNVTRKLLHEKKRPTAVGFYFSLGHSTVVLLLSLAVAFATGGAQNFLPQLHRVGGLLGTSISALFLLALAALNGVVLIQILHGFQAFRQGHVHPKRSLEATINHLGPLTRLFRPVIRMVDRSWKMYFVGFLFGLGFDTASEIGLLGISAASAMRELSLGSILLFPALFTAGMCLVDTTDGILMTHAYASTGTNPARRFYYNFTVTLFSVLVATIVGGIELCSLLADHFSLQGPFWTATQNISSHSTTLGLMIVTAFGLAWAFWAFRHKPRLS